MAIHAKNAPLSMMEIQGEYGGPFPLSLGALYRGAGKVPADAPASDNFQTLPSVQSGVQVPTSGPIQFSHFYGQSAYVAPPPPPPVTYPGATGQFDAYGGNAQTTAYATTKLLSDGTAQMSGTNNPLRTERWLTGSNGSAYEVSWEPHANTQDWPNVNGGNIPPSTWFTMNTQWSAQVTDADSQTTAYAVFYLRIREIANHANAVEYIVELNADGECFAVGTLLRTPAGDRVVESLAYDDVISSFSEPTMVDEDTDGWRDWKIESLANVLADTTAKIRGATTFVRSKSVKINGIHSTLRHTCFVFDGGQYGWKLAQDVTIGDSFVDADLNLIPITSIEIINEPTTFVALNAETLDTLQVKSGDVYILTHNVSA